MGLSFLLHSEPILHGSRELLHGIPRYGMYGMALARMFYGPITLLVYIPLAAELMRNARTASHVKTPTALLEEA